MFVKTRTVNRCEDDLALWKGSRFSSICPGCPGFESLQDHLVGHPMRDRIQSEKDEDKLLTPSN